MCKITHYYGQRTACNVGHYDYEEESTYFNFASGLTIRSKIDL